MTPLLVSVGCDQRAKLWSRAGSGGSGGSGGSAPAPSSKLSWTCSASLSLRGLVAGAGGWSQDGSVLGLGFGHLVTVWCPRAATLTATMTSESAQGNSIVKDSAGNSPVTDLVFGQGAQANLLYAVRTNTITAWNLLTLAPAWSLTVEPSPHTRLAACLTSPLVAVLQRDCVLLVGADTGYVEHRVEAANCTGGGAW